MRSFRLIPTLPIALALVAAVPATADAGSARGLFGLPVLSRADFNRLARQAGVPLFWVDDRNDDGLPAAAEVEVLGVGADRVAWIDSDNFTARFESAWRDLVEMRRREAVRRELDQGFPTLVAMDLTGLSPAEVELVRHVESAARKVEALHGRQMGGAAFADRIAALDPESRALFDRNQGPWCQAPQTENDPFCNALPDFPDRRWDAYPEGMSHDSALCKSLAERPDARDLLAPFAVVRKEGDALKAVPLDVAYGAEMKAIADDLRAAAKSARDAKEPAFAKYLLAAAAGFETNDWTAADEAWSRMDSRNSKWYLRVGPDEVGWDLCQEKAGFHVSFARVDRGSLELQDRLMPLRQEMETSLATLIGGPYKARKVSFHMPDFIEMVINAGDSRHPQGATMGQSLPNWGKVAEEGRGRTVVMTNLYRDPDSLRLSKIKAGLMLGPETMKAYSEDQRVSLIDVILHEATHNLGPCSDFKVDGRNPSEVFGGRVASVLEELKAQTGALYYADLLRRRGIMTQAEVNTMYVGALAWSFGHLSQGLFAASGAPKPYSQLSAVQIGVLVEEGALAWETTTDPATGHAVGRFEARFDRFPAAVEKLMARVGRIKATGDVAAATALLDPYVTGDRKGLVHVDEIQERLGRFPKATMVYTVRLPR